MNLNSKNIWIFRAVLIIIPIALLLILELALRIGGYQDQYSDVIVPYEYRHDYMTTNRSIGKLYFGNSSYGAFGTPEVFLKKKPSDLVRIFVLGGSSTAGYPYLYSGTFPAMLEQRLQVLYPDYTIEVLNLGMTAINSYTIRDFARACLEHQPDLLIIYAGHNEFYGALGSGSARSAIGTSRKLTLAHLQLKHLKLYQLVSIVAGALLAEINEPGDHSGTLMATMARDQAIPRHSPVYEKTRAIFQANLADIIDWCQEQDMPVLLTTLVSNLRDQAPFVSLHSDNIDTSSYNADLRIARALLDRGKYEAAQRKLEKLIAADSGYARSHYLLAQTCEGLSQYQTAGAEYQRARDLDGLRFRASSDFNDIIRGFGQRQGVFVCDTEKWLSNCSPNGLVGNNLMLEHLHPNLEGYFQMAKALSVNIVGQNILKITHPDLPPPVPEPGDDYFRAIIPLTELDRQLAAYRIQILMSGWPFSASDRYTTIADLVPTTRIGELAKSVLSGESNYEKAHVELAEYYRKNGMADAAINEYKVLATTFPANESPYLALGRLLVEAGRLDEAVRILKHTITLVNDSYSYKWLGTIYMNNDKPAQAIPCLSKSLKYNPRDFQARYNLSGAYFLTSDTTRALQQLEILLEENPRFPGAQKFYTDLKKAAGKNQQ